MRQAKVVPGLAACRKIAHHLFEPGKRTPRIPGFQFPPRAVVEMMGWTNPSALGRWLQLFLDTGFDVVFGGLLLTVVAALARTLPPAPVDRPRAGEGLERVGSALVARVLVAVVGVFLLVSKFG